MLMMDLGLQWNVNNATLQRLKLWRRSGYSIRCRKPCNRDNAVALIADDEIEEVPGRENRARDRR